VAEFKVTAPGGKSFIITAPDNASDADVQAYAQSQFAQMSDRAKKSDEAMRKMADPTADMSGTEKVLANIGAGMSNLGQGLQSTYTKVFGSDADKAAMDQDVLEKRRLDEQLANATTGGSALQLAGEVAPTLAIPAGGFASGAAGLAGKVLPKALGAVGEGLAGSTVADAALAGGLSGALAPTTSDESTLGRMAAGAALGGAVPFLGAKAADAVSRINPFGTGERAAAQAVGEKLGDQGGDAIAAAQKLADQLRAMSPQAATGAADLAGSAAGDVAGQAAGGIPLSVASRLNSPELAWLEIGSRARGAPGWSQLDTNYAQAVSDALRQATSEGSEIGSRIQTRNANWNANMADALKNADPEVFADHVQALQNHVNDWLAHDPERFDAPVRKVYQQLQSDLNEAGESFNPQDMQVIRRAFNGRANPQAATAYKAAPRESAAIQDVVGRMDDALNASTGGKWDAVKSGYTADVASVNEAKSAQQLADKYWDPTTGRPIGTGQGIEGDLPNITEAGFSRNVARDVNRYSPEALAQLQSIQDALTAKNLIQRVKTSGTAGGGSATAPTLFAAQDASHFGKAIADVVRAVPGGGMVMGLKDAAGKLANFQRDKALATALQDPTAMLRLLDRVQAAGQPLTPVQQALVRALRTGSTGAADFGANL
jgi:hypothetical protein